MNHPFGSCDKCCFMDAATNHVVCADSRVEKMHITESDCINCQYWEPYHTTEVKSC
jgi:hypothetical protein